MMEVTPHLKSVLINYQHSATKSLQGPGLSLVKPKREIESPEIKDEEFIIQVQAPFTVQQVPILTTPDSTCSERTETVLEGESISCFVVGGEKRLCLPQVLNSVLRDFCLQQINQECDQLQIYCSRCTKEQLNVLKNQRILPSSAPSCGLITKTDAERLCSALLYGNQTVQPVVRRKGAVSFFVYHECFGRCRAVCYPDSFTSKTGKCIECLNCQNGFTPQQFVRHFHGNAENRTVHWGFDSCNWRNYLLVCEDQIEHEQFAKYLDDMQLQYEGKLPFPLPPQVVEPTNKRKQIIPTSELIKNHDLPLKKQKLEEYQHLLPYSMQQLQQIYASMDSFYHPYAPELATANRHISAFKPVSQTIAESKIRKSISLNLYSDPPVLQHPERMVPMSESERFSGSFQPNVALAPPTPKKHLYGKTSVTISDAIKCDLKQKEQQRQSFLMNGHSIKKENCEETSSHNHKIDSAPVSVVKTPPNLLRYNSEIELSTDTEDSASETSEKTDQAKLEESLKLVDCRVREKIISIFKNVTTEQLRLVEDCRMKDNKISELEAKNKELELKLAQVHRHRTEDTSKIVNGDGTNEKLLASETTNDCTTNGDSIDDETDSKDNLNVNNNNNNSSCKEEIDVTIKQEHASVITSVEDSEKAIMKTAPE